jgi:hypothetical protein
VLTQCSGGNVVQQKFLVKFNGFFLRLGLVSKKEIPKVPFAIFIRLLRELLNIPLAQRLPFLHAYE